MFDNRVPDVCGDNSSGYQKTVIIPIDRTILAHRLEIQLVKISLGFVHHLDPVT